MVSTRDEETDAISVITSGVVSAACQKSMNTFIREPPQQRKDPWEPSGLECPEDKNNSYVDIGPPKLLSIPPKMKSYDEPTKK
jgi:hypothetical protein